MVAKKPAKLRSDTAQPARRKADGDRRESIIKVLTTSEERNAFQVAATGEGMSLSTWLRHVALKASKPT